MPIPLVEPEQASPQVQRIYDSLTQRFGRGGHSLTPKACSGR